jgi:hypothetical protein
MGAAFRGSSLAGSGYLKRLAFEWRDRGSSLESLGRFDVFGMSRMLERLSIFGGRG